MEYLNLFGSRHFLTEHEILSFLIDKVVDMTNSSIGYLHRYNHKTKQIEMNVWSKNVYKICNTIYDGHYPLERAGVWADCIRHGKTVVHNNYHKNFGAKNLPEGHYPISRHMSTCIRTGDDIVGIIGVGNAPQPYDSDDILYFEELSAAAWAQAQDKIKETNQFIQHNIKVIHQNSKTEVFLSIINALTRAIESCDEYTSFHHTNTAYVSCLIAKQLGLDEDRILGLRLAALMHDVGKIKVPPEILSKEEPLTKSEFERLKLHVESGANFFAPLNISWPIDEIIMQHHERIDGSGYPNGLIGDMICIEARIIAVADTFDCMVSERAYRKMPGVEKAIQQLNEGKGTYYDEQVVDALLHLYDKDPSLGGTYHF